MTVLDARLPLVFTAVAIFYLCILYLPSGYYRSYADPEPTAHQFDYKNSSFDWASVSLRHPIAQFTSLPTESSSTLPLVQYDFASSTKKPSRARIKLIAERRSQVKAAFTKSWQSYKRHAWLFDELTPVSGHGKNSFGGWAATLVDSLDTLWIMGLKNEFYEAVAAVAQLDWADTKDTACNFFETTIRHLGGLLAAYDLSHEEVLLRKAVELGDMLYVAFDTPSHMPPFWFDFQKAKDGMLVAGNHDPSASVTSSSLEFTRLSQLTGDHKYYDAVTRVTRFLEDSQNFTRLPGMWPTFFDMQNVDKERIESGQTSLSWENGFTLGALSDSLYEYLPKMHSLLGGKDPVYEKLYRGATEVITEHILFRPMVRPSGQSSATNILFAGTVWVEDNGLRLDPEGQHLACFVGGMYGIGGKLFQEAQHVELGMKLARGCAWGYSAFPTGLLPEIFGLQPCSTAGPCDFEPHNGADHDSQQPLHSRMGFTHARDARYILRPEAIESIFYMYRITGEDDLLDIAWDMFQAIRQSTETELAFSAISDVTETGETAKLDSMESFWLSETLKYFYLIFSEPELISLDEFVLNTEAHPLRRPRSR
ncbi:glycoside hydrolase family 47 protein [Microdochium trichocladiopsis]|uniref:alpha-1,2-Mannosidase n=1 Tax=Microdochium trichocladiopsis TaxID=1682393 RepID=A0A9P8YCJ0_9PEZI|nr:glycoside hydrolase family 47 protein [Microdochium trichocladiopsis]KAH7035978.1 glycoside hydrolase family 47 protein [Microdochium trichocladiopsis]